MRRSISLSFLVPTILALGAVPASAQPSFVAFETGPVRPLAIEGAILAAVNTPDNRLETFNVLANGITRRRSIPVGLEPCAVAFRSGGSEAWVVNHLSDSVSVVDLTAGRVTRTLLVGDEPRDIVITDPDGAGPLAERVFITTAHRGQHRTHSSISSVPGAGDPQFTTEGVGRADVWVFDADAPGAGVGGTPLEIIELFGDTPRALAVSADGATVYAAVFHSGNQTAVVNEGTVCDGFGGNSCSGDGITSPNGLGGGNLPGGNPGPSTNHASENAPEVGLVVQFDNVSGEWHDEGARNWSNGIRFFLPDLDVFEINADTLNETANFAGVGTILFNMAVNPVNGNVYVSNTDAQNLTRFEGPGTFGGSTVQGNLHQSRITVLDTGNVNPRHLNKHINYSVLPAPAGIKEHSLATPLDMLVSSDGATLYVAAFGSSKVGVYATADLENDTFDPTVVSADHISVSGGGPSGLALDETHQLLFVFTRFDNSISIVDLLTDTELNHFPLHNPEPDNVVTGRPFLYDAFNTSSNGEASCSSCHIFGDFDSIAWDLGEPDGDVKNNPQPINLEFGAALFQDINGTGNARDIHPMKGPMTTQTLRGMETSGHMHWRGDRARGFCGDDDPHTNDSELSFKNFILAFNGLVGSDQVFAAADCNGFMQQFTDFILDVRLPPNPVRALDNSLTVAENNGREFFLGNVGPDSGDGDGHRSDGTQDQFGLTLGFTCEGCHTLDASQGFFGTGGNASFENEPQIVKVSHLRNAYQKVGMFGMPDVDFNLAGNNGHLGDQVRGTGYLHDGSTDTLFRFLSAVVFNDGAAGPNIGFFGPNDGEAQRQDMEQFMLAFDTDLAPIVGQQVTLDDTNLADVSSRIALLEQRAGAAFVSLVLGGATTECDLVAQGHWNNMQRNALYDPSTDTYTPDSVAEPPISAADMRTIAQVPGQATTFMCVPPGSGSRIALDRDGDGAWNHDESLSSTDPANPGSVVGACSDGIDNDGDGAIDLSDTGCSSASGSIENPQCSDGFDNDGDGTADFGGDFNCLDQSSNQEAFVSSSSCRVGGRTNPTNGALWLAMVFLALSVRTSRRSRDPRFRREIREPTSVEGRNGAGSAT